MQLRYSPTSPYTRKVTVTAIETGLDGRIERIATNVWDPATDIARDNPLGKVPALILEDGTVLFDSPVICEYLDSLHDGPKVIPPAGPERWTALRRQAQADGVVDAAVLRLLESRRPESQRSSTWDARQAGVVARGLNAFETEAATGGLAGPLTIGHIALGCCLGWLDLRFPHEDWRAARPALTAWFEAFAARPSMQATPPADPA
jgi:glutathione S-transferase